MVDATMISSTPWSTQGSPEETPSRFPLQDRTNAGKGLAKGKAGKRKAAAKRKPVRKTRRRRRRRTAQTGQANAPALVRKARATARDRAREAETLKRLVPEYNQVRRSQEKLRERLQEVHQIERAVSRSLRQAAKRAKKLEAQLRDLV